MDVKVTAPGNLLLFGEYAVTEPGGMGIACAVETAMIVSASKSSTCSVLNSSGDQVMNPLIESVLQSSFTRLQSSGLPGISPCGIYQVDDRSFYDGNGSKIGFGSSAALAVTLTAAILALYLDSDKIDLPSIAATALDGHRKAQGGRGSGYDVLVSTYGSSGLFTGGENPGWQPMPVDWIETLCLAHGDKPVNTRVAIDNYTTWKKENPGPARKFLVDNNMDIKELAKLNTFNHNHPVVTRLSARGVWLGYEINVSAEINGQAGLPEGCLVKALGAGNELGFVVGRDPGTLPAIAGLTNLAVSRKGCTIESQRDR
jgi:phosphomevalonate kinase